MRTDEVHRFLTATLGLYTETARHTGRTEAMLDRVKSGDVIVVPNQDVLRHIRHRLQARELADVMVAVASPLEFSSAVSLIAETRRTKGSHIHFDHSWIEKFYHSELDYAAGTIARTVEEWERRNSRGTLTATTDVATGGFDIRLTDWSLEPRHKRGGGNG